MAFRNQRHDPGVRAVSNFIAADYVVINETVVADFVNDPRGLIAQVLEGTAREIALPEAYNALSQPAELSHIGPHGNLRWAVNQTEIPRSRSGALQKSLVVNPPMRDAVSLVVYVSASEQIAPHAKYLRTGDNRQGKAWKFLPDRPYYTYTEPDPN